MKMIFDFLAYFSSVSFPFSVSLSSVLFVIFIIIPLLKPKDFFRYAKKFKSIYIILFLFYISYLISSLLSPDTLSSLKRGREFLFYLGVPAVSFIFKDFKKKRNLFKAFSFITIISVFYSIFRILNGTATDGRAHGFFLHPLTYAGFLTIPIIFSLGFFLISNKKEKLLHLTFFLILLTGLILTDSRGVFIAIFVSSFYLIFKINKRILIPYLLTGLVIIVVIMIKNPLGIRSKGERKTSTQKRIELIRAFPDFFLKRPLFGYGRIHTKEWVKKQKEGEYKKENLELLHKMIHFHVSYLQILFFTGIFGFILLYLFYGTLLFMLHRNSKKSFLSILAFTSLLAFLIHGFFEINIFADEILLPLFFFTGLSLEDEDNSFLRL